MNRHAIGVLGVALLAAGVVGMIAGLAVVISWAGQAVVTPSTTLTVPLSQEPSAAPEQGEFSSSGAHIFETGVGHAGPVPSTEATTHTPLVVTGGPGCAGCHGVDGRGELVQYRRGLPNLQAPDITYAALTSPTVSAGRPQPGWTDAQIARAIRTGVTPIGRRLDPVMPRYDMDATDMADLIAYLKELSAQ